MMNDTTFQGSGNVVYVPVIVNDKLKRTNADLIRAMSDEELADWLAKNDPECDPPEWWLDWLRQEISE